METIKEFFKQFSGVDPSILKINRKTGQVVLDESKLDQITGYDRLRFLFYKDETGNMNPDLARVIDGGQMGLFGGTMIGGLKAAARAHNAFLDENDATKFVSSKHAMMELQRTIFNNFIKQGFNLGLKIGAFAVGFLGVATLVSTYRNKYSPFDYTIAGGAVGGMFKSNFGFKGVTAGSIVGCFIGTMGGLLLHGIVKLTGLTMEQFLSANNSIRYEKDRQFKRMLLKESEGEAAAIHESMVKFKGEHTLDDLDNLTESVKV